MYICLRLFGISNRSNDKTNPNFQNPIKKGASILLVTVSLNYMYALAKILIDKSVILSYLSFIEPVLYQFDGVYSGKCATPCLQISMLC